MKRSDIRGLRSTVRYDPVERRVAESPRKTLAVIPGRAATAARDRRAPKEGARPAHRDRAAGQRDRRRDAAAPGEDRRGNGALSLLHVVKQPLGNPTTER